MSPERVAFAGGDRGPWIVQRIERVRGEPLEPCARVTRIEGAEGAPDGARWVLDGVRTHERYTARAEHDRLVAVQPQLGREASRAAVLIPLSKSEAWWALSQDERREILEERSGHIRSGLRYLPAIARRLYHGREIGGTFDFLTWFEFAPADAPASEALLGELRAAEEWRWVVREVEVWLTRDA